MDFAGVIGKLPVALAEDEGMVSREELIFAKFFGCFIM